MVRLGKKLEPGMMKSYLYGGMSEHIKVLGVNNMNIIWKYFVIIYIWKITKNSLGIGIFSKRRILRVTSGVLLPHTF